MSSNIKALLVTGSILVILISALIISNINSKIPSNDISVTGNTAGNLNNGGLFLELNGKIYFANSYDNGCLYSMNADQTEVKKITASSVSSLNGAGDYLYYFMDSGNSGQGMGYIVRTFGVYRSTLDGSDSACLVKDGCITMQLVGDYLYYQRYNNKNFTKFHKVKTDKSEDILVSDSIINPAACHNGIIYYNGTDKDHYLYALDTRTDTSTAIMEGNIWYPIYYQGYIYYMDLSSDYSLCRYSLSDNTVEMLTADRVEAFNVGGSYIYYQKNEKDNNALMRIRLDGSNPEVVAEGVYTNIHMTSNYVYFKDFFDEITIYHTPAEGMIHVTPFTAARDAALAQ